MNIRRNILGGIPGLFDEADFERETSALTTTIVQGVGGIFQDIITLGQDITGLETRTKIKNHS